MVTSLQPILPSEWSLCLDDLVWKTEIVIPQKEITHNKICRLLSGDRCCYKVQQMARIFLASISNIDQVPKQAESMNSTEDKSIFLILLFTGPVFLAFFLFALFVKPLVNNTWLLLFCVTNMCLKQYTPWTTTLLYVHNKTCDSSQYNKLSLVLTHLHQTLKIKWNEIKPICSDFFPSSGTWPSQHPPSLLLDRCQSKQLTAMLCDH